jgi:hypothetical protein
MDCLLLGAAADGRYGFWVYVWYDETLGDVMSRSHELSTEGGV